MLCLVHGHPDNIRKLQQSIEVHLLHSSTREIRLLDFCMNSDQYERFLKTIAYTAHKAPTGAPRFFLRLLARMFGYKRKADWHEIDNTLGEWPMMHNCIVLPIGIREDEHHR